MFWLNRIWSSMRGTCATCGEKLVIQTAREAHGVSDDASVTLMNLPYRGCPSGFHDRRYPSRQFVLLLSRALLDSHRFPVVTTDPTRETKCGRCGKALGDLPNNHVAVTHDVTLPGLPAFQISIRGPTLTCPYCKTNQLSIGLKTFRSFARAIQGALKAARLEP